MLRLLLASALAAASPAPWREAHQGISARKNEVSARLTEVWTALRARLASERPDLLARLSAEPPKPLPTGYGLLPPVGPDEPEKEAPHEVRSSLAELRRAVAAHGEAIGELSAQLAAPAADLERLLKGYLHQAEVFRQIDNDLNYHAVWQPKAAQFKPFNGLLARYRAWRASPSDAAKAALERELVAFAPAPGLRVEKGALRVVLQTDIEDEAFLKTFAEAVELHWNASEALRKAGLRIALEWRRRAPASLYPEGPPARGAEIDTLAHAARFAPDAPVLSTGAKAVFGTQRALFLDPAPTTRRVLAHEFAHLLGFADAYLHAFEGSEDDPDGVVWWEVCPFPAELMCNARGGRVSDGMARRLLGAYARP